MIIDRILDRKDGHPYRAKEFYNDVFNYGEIGFDITRAMDSGSEKDVKKALCNYIMGEYNPKICDYINKVQWLEDDATNKELNNSINGFINAYNDFYNDEKVQNTVISSDFVREQMISALEEFIRAVQDTVDEYKQLDKELKL